jgi:hypothetical protein
MFGKVVHGFWITAGVAIARASTRSVSRGMALPRTPPEGFRRFLVWLARGTGTFPDAFQRSQVSRPRAIPIQQGAFRQCSVAWCRSSVPSSAVTIPTSGPAMSDALPAGTTKDAFECAIALVEEQEDECLAWAQTTREQLVKLQARGDPTANL